MPKWDRQEYNAYMREYMLKRYHKKRKELIDKLGGKCVRCGSNKDLEMHHKDPKKKKFTLGSAWSQKDKFIIDELLKCELLCWACHVEEHTLPIVHGVSNFWRCSCGPCSEARREWKSRYNKKYYKKKKVKK